MICVPNLSILNNSVEAQENNTIPTRDVKYNHVIRIFYDAYNRMLQSSADRIYFNIRYVYPNIDRIPVGDIYDLEVGLFGADVAILLFNTTVDYVIIGSTKENWDDFAFLLSNYNDVDFILLIGNTYKLNQYKKENWHYEEIEYDSIAAYETYAIWRVAKYFESLGPEYSNYAYRLKENALSYCFDNINDIFESKIKPYNVLGSRDEEYRKAKIQKYLEEHPSSIKASVGDENNPYGPVFKIKAFSKNPDGYDYLPFPSMSGIAGSVGDFIDQVLGFLTGNGADYLTLNFSLIDQIVDKFKSVLNFIGDPSKLGEGSMLKEFLGSLIEEFPYIDEFKDYLDMFIDGFYALKGNIDSIINFLLSVIDLIFPSETGVDDIIDQLKSITTELLSITDTVMSMFSKITDNKISIILQYVMSKISNITINEFLKNITGISDLTGLYNKLSNLFSIGMQIFTLQNISDFTQKLFTLATEILDIFDAPNIGDVMQKIQNLVNLALIFLEKKKDSLNQLLQNAITAFIDQSYISNLQEMVNDILDEINDAIKEAKTDINNFRTTIENIINQYVSDYPELGQARQILKETITLITAISNPGFDVSQATSLIEILKDILNQYLGDYADDIQRLMLILNCTVIPIGLLDAPSRIQQAFLKQLNPLLDMRKNILQYLIDTVKMIIERTEPGVNIEEFLHYIENGTQIISGILNLISEVRERPFDGITTALMMVASISQTQLFGNMTIGNITAFFKALLPDLMGLDRTPSLEECLNMILEALGGLNPKIKETVSTVFEFLYNIREIMRNGVKWFTTKVLDWVAGYISDFVSDLIGDLEDLIDQYTFYELEGDMNFGFAGLDMLTFSYYLKIDAGLDIDETGLCEEIKDMVVKGKYMDFTNSIKVFETIIDHITITPIIEASIKLGSMMTNTDLLGTILDMLGAEVQIQGEARFKLVLFSFKSGTFDMSEFLDLKEWYLMFSLSISKTFSIFDLIGAPSVASVAEDLGLDLITVTLTIGFKLEINLGSESESSGVHSILSLEITVAGTLHIGIDVAIAEVSLDFTLSISFTFTVDTSKPDPLTFQIKVEYKLKIHAEFLFVGKTWNFGGTIYTYTFPEGSETPQDHAGGFDEDGDGLPDTFEMENFGFAPTRSDTDGDGLGDNEELNAYGTDPLDPDTDGDGLTDYEEIITYGTNPFMRDTDGDRLTDYEETKIYGTDPHEVDTDGDGLDDHFEVHYTWDISNVTISITGVIIGGETYYDHTDPLNPDTDGDGLLDGQEGPLGGYYLPFAYDFGDHPIIFNYGYTHPLDNDTDDDSFMQETDGTISEPRTFLMSMTDKDEIDGITVVYIDPEEGPELRTFRTNPICPDSDQDTGSSSILLSDGYELSRTPPTDPLNNDCDGDGIIDGNEGTSSPYSNKTDPLNPDTDGDGLGDMQEIVLCLDPGNPDTDGDMVSDGDEFLKFGTNPRLWDSDNDRLSDGEELFYWHSNPMIKDSDNDGISDGDEVLIYFSDPMDEDSDNDNLTDPMEIFVYHTNPLEADSDYDGIVDGEEIFLYGTNPLDWDSDDDSILYPNETGGITWSMSDYREVIVFGTDPLDSDTDNDGISDALETYISSGTIPNFNPINVDATDPDTDDDGLLDGVELYVKNASDIIYPYVSYYITYPLNSSPLSSDTDGDGVDDYREIIIYASNANMTDTDKDGLTDYEEIVEYNTSPIFWDTDKDNISDYDEVHGFTASAGYKYPWIKVPYVTDPADPDTDDDLLPDGYEVQILKSNPRREDENDNDILDGLEFDTDEDGLADGLEFYVYNTSMYPGGGPLNPDSDMDGLSDGSEVYIYGTDPADPDTDDDGILDGAEIAVGTDPLVYTEWDEYVEALRILLGNNYIKILTPRGSIIDKFVDVRVINKTDFSEMWFRYKKEGGEYSDNYSLTYDPSTLQWVYSDIVWEEGKYTIEVFGRLPNGTVLPASEEFEYVSMEEELSSAKRTWFLIGLAVGAAIVIFVIFGLPRIIKEIKKRRQAKREEKVEIGGEESG